MKSSDPTPQGSGHIRVSIEPGAVQFNVSMVSCIRTQWLVRNVAPTGRYQARDDEMVVASP